MASDPACISFPAHRDAAASAPTDTSDSSIYFSLIETAKENGLDPYRYLTWVFKTAPMIDMKDCDQVEKLLPINAPEKCRAGKGKAAAG